MIVPRYNKKFKMFFNPPVFREYEAPNGYLPTGQMGAHGCFYYSLIGKNTYDEFINNPIVLEGDRDPDYDLWNLWKSISLLYGVDPMEMGNFWPAVRLQWDVLGIKVIPDQYQWGAKENIFRTLVFKGRNN